jgi:transposase InsO family protein
VRKFTSSCANRRVSFSKNRNTIATDEVEVLLQEQGDLFAFPRSVATSLSAVSRLWHRRLGHVNQATVKRVLDSNPDLKKQKTPGHICEDCAETKSVRASFPKSTNRTTTRKLELVHSDVWGQIDPTSLGGAKYAVIFVDDYTRIKRLYFMARKSEVPEMFQQYIAEVATPEGLTIKRLRSDCGGEYKSARMRALCQKLGIKQEFSAPYSQAQNGVAERSWRTLGQMAKAMLKDSGLPKHFWAEAMDSACFTANRLPTDALDGDNPYHRWTGDNPNYKRFRVFGCPVFVHVNAKSKKLDDSAKKCIFLGYDHQSTAYRIWNPETRRVINSVHVRFQEQGLPVEEKTRNAPVAEGNDVSFAGRNQPDRAVVSDSGVEESIPQKKTILRRILSRRMRKMTRAMSL